MALANGSSACARASPAAAAMLPADCAADCPRASPATAVVCGGDGGDGGGGGEGGKTARAAPEIARRDELCRKTCASALLERATPAWTRCTTLLTIQLLHTGVAAGVAP